MEPLEPHSWDSVSLYFNLYKIPVIPIRTYMLSNNSKSYLFTKMRQKTHEHETCASFDFPSVDGVSTKYLKF